MEKKQSNQPSQEYNLTDMKASWKSGVDFGVEVDAQYEGEHFDKWIKPGGKILTMTIQDLLSIPAILKNALALIEKGEEGNFNDRVTEDECLDSIEELKHLLSLFKKD